MLTYQFNKDVGLLHLRPQGPLSKEDFDGIADVIAPYIKEKGDLSGLIIETEHFPGWEGLSTTFTHLRFIHEHHRKIKKVALVTDSKLGDFAEDIASHFVSAEIRHFKAHQDLLAHDWVRSD